MFVMFSFCRYISRVCSKLSPEFPCEQSKKRSMSVQQQSAGAPPEGSSSSSMRRRRRMRAGRSLEGLLLLVAALQHLLPLVYCDRMRGRAAVLVPCAVHLAQHFSALAGGEAVSGSISSRLPQQQQQRGGGEGAEREEREALLRLRHELLRASCALMAASALCNGLINQDSMFDVSASAAPSPSQLAHLFILFGVLRL
jgi:hypothetical protein